MSSETDTHFVSPDTVPLLPVLIRTTCTFPSAQNNRQSAFVQVLSSAGSFLPIVVSVVGTLQSRKTMKVALLDGSGFAAASAGAEKAH